MPPALTDGTQDGTITAAAPADTTSTPAAGSAAATGSGSPALINTSSASRANYASNVTSLNESLANVPKQSFNYIDSKGQERTVEATSGEEALKIAPDIAEHSGVIKNPPAGGADTTTATGADPASAATGDGKPAAGADAAADPATELLSKLPPEVAGIFGDTLKTQNENIQSAQDTLKQAAATMANDPAAQSAVATIYAQYGVLIKAMQEKNRQILGGYTRNAARDGSMQYANDMHENFMSEEMDKATQRISDLIAKENALVLQSNNAYQNNDIKAFNAAQTALNKTKADKATTLSKLLTATNNQVKAVQAQQKIEAASKKQQLASDTTTAAKIAAGMAATLRAEGITDPKHISAYVAQMAEKNGITNPDILAGALETEKQKLAKTLYTVNRPYSTKGAPKPKGGGTDGGYNYTGEDVSTYTSFLNKGGKGPNGTTYAGRGSDSYVDPGAYVAAYNDWIANNGTPAGFLKKFPVKNVNPASIPNLPAGLQPTKKAADSTIA